MSVREYEILRKKYMGDEPVSKINDNSMFNIYPKVEEEKGNTVKIITDYGKKNVNSNKTLTVNNNYNWNKLEEIKGVNSDYNLDENGNEVLNENLFRNTTMKDFKSMRSTYSNKFIAKKSSKSKDKKGATMYNFHKKSSNNINNINSAAGRSYYGGFKKNE